MRSAYYYKKKIYSKAWHVNTRKRMAMSHNGIEECSENDDLLRASGSAVQSHERQCYKLKQRLKNSKQPEAKQGAK